MCRTPLFRPGLLDIINYWTGLQENNVDLHQRDYYEYYGGRHDKLVGRLVVNSTEPTHFAHNYNLTKEDLTICVGNGIEIDSSTMRTNAQIIPLAKQTTLLWVGPKASIQMIIDAVEAFTWPLVPLDHEIVVQRSDYCTGLLGLDAEDVVRVKVEVQASQPQPIRPSLLRREQWCYLVVQLLRAVQTFLIDQSNSESS